MNKKSRHKAEVSDYLIRNDKECSNSVIEPLTIITVISLEEEDKFHPYTIKFIGSNTKYRSQLLKSQWNKVTNYRIVELLYGKKS